MRKSKRSAVKLETKIQALTTIKVSGTIDERMYARRKLQDGLKSRYIAAKRYSRCDPTDTVLK